MAEILIVVRARLPLWSRALLKLAPAWRWLPLPVATWLSGAIIGSVRIETRCGRGVWMRMQRSGEPEEHPCDAAVRSHVGLN